MRLPNFKKAFDYENNFYLSCDNSRFGKILAHYELFKLSLNVPGDIIECGVYKGASFVRFAAFRDIFNLNKRIIGFDTFDSFPETQYESDKQPRKRFVEGAGLRSIGRSDLTKVLRNKKIKNYHLIKGDICTTLPNYVKRNPHLKISVLNLDTDIYEPSVTVLNCLWNHIVKGGVLILDDYGVFPGETKAVDDFFSDKNIQIKKYNFSKTPCYIIK